ncbi:MAG: hypothetical protein ACXVCU_19750, partial [Bdellovibrio sp.]
MNTLKFILFLFVFVLNNFSWGASWSQSLPLETTENKAAAFLKITHLISSMTDGAARYGVDPVTLLGNQILIEKEIFTDSSYLNLKQQHLDLISFAVFKEDSSKATDDKEILWNNMVKQSRIFVQSQHLTEQSQIVQQIKERLSSPLFSKSQGIIVGLAQIIPAQFKKDFFAASVKEKIQLLKQSLPEEIVSHGFAPNKLGWNDTQISKQEIIDRLQKSYNLEQEFTFLLTYLYDLEVLASGTFTTDKDFLNMLGAEVENKKLLEQFFTSQIVKFKPAKPITVEASLYIKEIPPVVSLFRGFAGNDCSTLFSFPFVNSPNEYTFLILDPKQNVKGYAQGTRVRAQGQDSLYLHTVAGPRISYDDALLILKVFAQQKVKMGFANILLPAVEKLDAMINFMPVREAYRKALTNNQISISYEDSAIRDKLKTMFKITKTYDDASENTYAFQLNEDVLGNNIKSEITDSVEMNHINIQAEKKSLVGMLLQMNKRVQTNKAMIGALASYVGLTAENINALYTVAQNNTGLNKKEFIEKFESELKTLDIDFGQGYFKKNISLIANGLLNAPDVISDMQAIEVVISNLLEQRELSTVETFLNKQRTLFKNINIASAFFKSFYNDVHEAENKNPDILKVALNESTEFLIRNKQVQETVFKSKKAWGIITEFYLENVSRKNVLPFSVKALVEDKLKPFITLRNNCYSKLITAQSELEYINSINEMASQLKSLGGTDLVLEILKRDLYTATVD